MQDVTIINLYLSRDENAINQTDKLYGSKLRHFAHSILKNTQDSEESVNDTYLKTWNTIPPQRPTYFYAYLSKICRFICFGKLDYKNAQKRSAEIINLSDELINCISTNIDTELDEKFLVKAIENFLDTLKKENRVIFLKRYWYCQSIEQIASSMKFSQSKVKTSLFRSREKLKKHLESEEIFI